VSGVVPRLLGRRCSANAPCKKRDPPWCTKYTCCYGEFKFKYEKPFLAGQSLEASVEKIRQRDKQIREMLPVLSKLFLRRLKTDVATELPRKTDRTIYCNMTKEQHKVYMRVRNSRDVRHVRLSNAPCYKCKRLARGLSEDDDSRDDDNGDMMAAENNVGADGGGAGGNGGGNGNGDGDGDDGGDVVVAGNGGGGGGAGGGDGGGNAAVGGNHHPKLSKCGLHMTEREGLVWKHYHSPYSKRGANDCAHCMGNSCMVLSCVDLLGKAANHANLLRAPKADEDADFSEPDDDRANVMDNPAGQRAEGRDYRLQLARLAFGVNAPVADADGWVRLAAND
jgi:hypothetical protein